MRAGEGTGNTCGERTGRSCPSHNFKCYDRSKSAGEQRCNKCLYGFGTLWNLLKYQPRHIEERGQSVGERKDFYTSRFSCRVQPLRQRKSWRCSSHKEMQEQPKHFSSRDLPRVTEQHLLCPFLKVLVELAMLSTLKTHF